MPTHNALELTAQLLWDQAQPTTLGELGLTPKEFVKVLTVAANHKLAGNNVQTLFTTEENEQVDDTPKVAEPVDTEPTETADNSPNMECVYSLAGLVTRIARKPDNSWDFAKLQADMIQSELDEMFKAIEERDAEEYFDSAHDIIFLTGALGYMQEHDYMTGYKEMVSALMTRFDTSLAAANATRDKYNRIGVQTFNRCVNIPGIGQRWVTYVAEETHVGEEHYPQNKWLKSSTYQKPSYSNIPVLM